jgi:hypothetical protein
MLKYQSSHQYAPAASSKHVRTESWSGGRGMTAYMERINGELRPLAVLASGERRKERAVSVVNLTHTTASRLFKIFVGDKTCQRTTLARMFSVPASQRGSRRYDTRWDKGSCNPR